MANATARVRTDERITPQRSPARTPAEIAARLFTLAEKLDRRLKKGRLLTAEEICSVANRMRTYAVRLRATNAHGESDPRKPKEKVTRAPFRV